MPLAQVLRQLPSINEPDLLVGINTADDAAVYRLNKDMAVIQTLDFFPPIVDDPYIFGQIAAANALSDVYAMGGRPLIALNIVLFPECLDLAILEKILQGGATKVAEAGAVIAGGHSVVDNEPKYGLSVMGIVHPEKILMNANAKPGDVLISTKALGTGIINTAIKGNVASSEIIDESIKQMIELNAKASKVVVEAEVVNACTDITGFGLLGHASEMAKASGVSFELWSDKCAFLPGAVEFARMGMVPAGSYNNRKSLERDVIFDKNVARELQDIMFDPQTSGGLLVSVPEQYAHELNEHFKKNGVLSSVIGKVMPRGEYPISVK